MTNSTTKAPAELLPGSPTTKSLCPAGAGIIDQGEAPRGAHTPPQACATPAIDRAIATPPETPHAQLAEGYGQVDEPCVQVPITWIQVLHERNNIANNTPPSADPSVRAQVFYALDTCNGIIKGMHHLLSTTETPATTGHTTTEEDKMTTTQSIEELQNVSRALQADQILQKHNPCSTCGGQAPDCPDCDGVRAKPEAPAEYPGTGEPVRRPEVAQRARELMAANPKLSVKRATVQAKLEITEAGNRSRQAIPTAPGTPFEGGFYAGRFQIDGEEYALIVSPKEAGEIDGAQWGEYGQAIPATSYCDGLANTQAMAEAGSEMAKQLLALQIGEHNDWYLPSRDELELCYRNLKPTTRENYSSFRDGDNPSSVPPCLPYTEEAPVQTTVAAFQAGGSEAFEEAWYWASTQYSPYLAWGQYFDDGYQYHLHKILALRARAVRRFIID